MATTLVASPQLLSAIHTCLELMWGSWVQHSPPHLNISQCAPEKFKLGRLTMLTQGVAQEGDHTC